MFKTIINKFVVWKKKSNEKRFRKKLMKQYIKVLKNTQTYNRVYGSFKVQYDFYSRSGPDIASLIQSIADSPEMQKTSVKI